MKKTLTTKTMLDLTSLIMISLATYRFTRLLVKEDGPMMLIDSLRFLLGVRRDPYGVCYGEPGSLADMFTCKYCLSLWIAVAMTFIHSFMPWVVLFAGAAGLVSLIYDLQGE